MTATAPALERHDIQGDILRAYGNDYDRTSYLFVRVGDAAGGRAWLGGMADRVVSAAPWSGPKPDAVLNVALTYAGLEALGVPPPVLSSFSDELRQGMAARAELLGDTGESAPSRWEGGLGTGAAHVLLTVNAKTSEHLQTLLHELEEGMRAAGVEAVHEQHARMLQDAREHFGFADGYAQPAVEGDSDERAPGGGVALANGKWRALAAGEFILGYPDEDTRYDPQRRLPSSPAEPLGRNGTYMVWRKLYQDVALFRRTLRDAAERYGGGDQELLRAKVVGRWSNGTPIVKSPERPIDGFDASTRGGNDFRYLDVDTGGHRCPIGAHVRRANPRDGLGWSGLDDAGLLTFRHRLIRRGMPYGPSLAAGVLEDDGEDRGLVFVGFNASLSRQFEGIQVQWLNDGNVMHLGHDKDFLLGDAGTTGKMTLEGEPPFFLASQRAFVRTRGGEYLFVPGLRALRAIAKGM